MTDFVSLRNVVKSYDSGGSKYGVLNGIDLSVGPDDYVAITGPSGCGKSTLLAILGQLVVPTSGEVFVNGVPTDKMPDRQRSLLRSQMFGFVFQTADLLPSLTVLENVLLPAQLAGIKTDTARAQHLLESVGLSDRRSSVPAQLSGGEACRVALARALMNRPRVVLADEPTGNLDGATGESVVQLLESQRTEGRALVAVTHNEKLAQRAMRRLRLHEGRIVEQQPRAALSGGAPVQDRLEVVGRICPGA